MPTVTSVSPNEVGSAGNFKVIIHGTHFEEVTSVKYGVVPATKIITTGTPTKGQCKVKSTTELECFTPFHEHTKRSNVIVSNTAGESAPTPSDEMTFWPEIYRSEIGIGATHVPSVGYGQIRIESPQSQTQYECVNIGFGAGWNVADETPAKSRAKASASRGTSSSRKGPPTELRACGSACRRNARARSCVLGWDCRPLGRRGSPHLLV